MHLMLYLAENQVSNLRQASLIASYTEKCSSNISIRKCYFLDLEKLKRLKETKFPIYQMNHPIPGSQPSLAKLFHSPITAIFKKSRFLTPPPPSPPRPTPLWKGGGITLFRTFKNKKTTEKGHVWKESRVTTQGRKEVQVGTLLLGNDKNNVIPEKVFSCFLCLSFKCVVQVTSFRTKS